MQSQQGLWFRSRCLSTAAVSVLGIYRVDKRDKSNGSTKRIVIGLRSDGFWSVWGEIKLPPWDVEGKKKMRVEKVYAHYFVLWEDAVSGLRKVVSHSLQAHPPPLGGEWEPSPGPHRPPGSALCPPVLHSPSRNALPAWSPHRQEDQEVLTDRFETRKFSIRVGTWCFSDTTGILGLAGFQLL